MCILTSSELFETKLENLVDKTFLVLLSHYSKFRKIIENEETQLRTFVLLEGLGLEARHHRRLYALRSWKYEIVKRGQDSRVQFEVPKLVFILEKPFRQKLPVVRRTDILQLRFG
jgi:hypothetical protein